MSFSEIARDLQAQIRESVYVEAGENGRHYIATPFVFGDGDQPVIALIPHDSGWMLSDLGNTMFRLGFQLDSDAMLTPDSQRRLHSALSMAGISRRDDELTKPLQNGNYADALFDFIHALLKIDELGDFGTALSALPAPIRHQCPADSDAPVGARRPQIRTVVSELLGAVLPAKRVSRNWHDPEWDHNKEYPVDFRINGMRKPLFLHALGSNSHAMDATITVYRFNDQHVDGRHVAIFRDDTRLNQRVKAKLEAVCDESFGNLERQSSAIQEFLRKETVDESQGALPCN